MILRLFEKPDHTHVKNQIKLCKSEGKHAFQGYLGKWIHLAVTYKGIICIVYFCHCY